MYGSIGISFYMQNEHSLGFVFTVGEAVRSTCGKRHEEEEKEEKNFEKLGFLWGKVTSCEQM